MVCYIHNLESQSFHLLILSNKIYLSDIENETTKPVQKFSKQFLHVCFSNDVENDVDSRALAQQPPINCSTKVTKKLNHHQLPQLALKTLFFFLRVSINWALPTTTNSRAWHVRIVVRTYIQAAVSHGCCLDTEAADVGVIVELFLHIFMSRSI